MGVSRNSYSSSTPKTPLPLAMEELLILRQESYYAMLFYFFQMTTKFSSIQKFILILNST